jgi:hypothetical protein
VNTIQAAIAEIVAEALRDAANEIDAGPNFPLPPSIISALIRERADRVAAGLTP